jgi:hypothetical protein
MENVQDLKFEGGTGQLDVEIATEEGEHKLNGFDSLFLNHVDKIINSDFEDNTLFFRDQPYQKLIMSKTSDGVLELTLIHPDNDRDKIEMEVEKERFKEFLKKIREALKE